MMLIQQLLNTKLWRVIAEEFRLPFKVTQLSSEVQESVAMSQINPKSALFIKLMNIKLNCN